MSTDARPQGRRLLRAGDTPASTWNVANLITIARILLAPVFVALLLADGGEFGPLRYAAGVLFIVAIATDSVDGHLARSRNLVTDLGKLLDPIADKVLTGAAFVILAVLGDLWWPAVALVLLREWGITVMRLAIAKRVVMPASRGGKLKTVLQSVTLPVALLADPALLGGWVVWVVVVLMTATVVVTVVTGVDYVVRAVRGERIAP